jgi:hypothetical protein
MVTFYGLQRYLRFKRLLTATGSNIKDFEILLDFNCFSYSLHCNGFWLMKWEEGKSRVSNNPVPIGEEQFQKTDV